MNIVFPVNLDSPVFNPADPTTVVFTIQRADDFDFIGVGGVQMHVSGRDSSQQNGGTGTRITNLTRVHGGRLYKYCPHCEQIRPQTEYGDSGRTTDEFRDQSNCNDCRSQY